MRNRVSTPQQGHLEPHLDPPPCMSIDKTVLLQTARVTAFNPGNPAIQREIRIILDCGNQRSYITEQA